MKITMKHIYQLGMNAIPRSGDWVTIKGNHMARRGFRIPRSIIDLGVRHMDVYFAFSERVQFRLEVDGPEWLTSNTELKRDLLEGTADNAGIDTQMQLTTVQIVSPARDEIRFFNGEVVRFADANLIGDMLAENYLEVIPFAKPNPILDEAIRDLVDAYQVDGLTLPQAQEECLRRRIIKQGDLRFPTHFYRPTGEYKDRFVEDTGQV